VHRTWSQGFGAPHVVPGFWCTARGPRVLVHHTWSQGFGAPHVIPGFHTICPECTISSRSSAISWCVRARLRSDAAPTPPRPRSIPQTNATPISTKSSMQRTATTSTCTGALAASQARAAVVGAAIGPTLLSLPQCWLVPRSAPHCCPCHWRHGSGAPTLHAARSATPPVRPLPCSAAAACDASRLGPPSPPSPLASLRLWSGAWAPCASAPPPAASCCRIIMRATLSSCGVRHRARGVEEVWTRLSVGCVFV